jgi:hypothetical protein
LITFISSEMVESTGSFSDENIGFFWEGP